MARSTQTYWIAEADVRRSVRRSAGTPSRYAPAPPVRSTTMLPPWDAVAVAEGTALAVPLGVAAAEAVGKADAVAVCEEEADADAVPVADAGALADADAEAEPVALAVAAAVPVAAAVAPIWPASDPWPPPCSAAEGSFGSCRSRPSAEAPPGC